MDIRTAFLYVELCEGEDGIAIATHPAILVRMGLVQEGIVWVLKKALYGLRVAPNQEMELEEKLCPEEG